MKKLLLVGNRIIDKDLSDMIDGKFDAVFRINRMNNFGKTGTQLDYVFISQVRSFFTKFKCGDFKEQYKKAKIVFCNIDGMKDNYLFKKYVVLTDEQFVNLQCINVAETAKNICNGLHWPTSTIEVLDWILHAPMFNDYQIWICGIDVEGRGELFKTTYPWKGTCHEKCGMYEEQYLKRLINDKKIFVLDE